MSNYDNFAPPVNTEGATIRWEKTTPNGFQHWRLKQGFFQLTSIPQSDFALLEWGDRIQEPRDRGMIQYVNVCSGCGEKFLNGTLILVPFYHSKMEELSQPEKPTLVTQGFIDRIEALMELPSNERVEAILKFEETDPELFEMIVAKAKLKERGA